MTGNAARRREPRRRPAFDALEDRQLLYGTTGAEWVRPIRITYSFVPDGTDIGGVASNLQSAFNGRFGVDVWKNEFVKAAAVWQRMAKVNFAQVTDDGSPIGVAGNQQGDARFGDIRIGGFVQDAGNLAFAYLPPQINGGTSAGDMFFNTGQSWQINGSAYDVMTVAVHEFGHALGLHHSTDTTAVMWPSYNATKRDVTVDDTSGIRQIYNARQNDFFDANGSNNSYLAADSISGYLNAAGQLTMSALDSTTPLEIASGDSDWLKITVPANTTGTMVVRMQSKHLSLLSPYVAIYNANASTRLTQQSSTAYGDTISVSLGGVTPGQTYLLLAKGANTGISGYGAYALQVNFGATPLPAIALPSTTLAQQADQGGGTLANGTGGSGTGTASTISQAGDPNHFFVYDDGTNPVAPEPISSTTDTTPKNGQDVASTIKVGRVLGKGHVLTTGAHGHDHDHDEASFIDLTPRRHPGGPARLAFPGGAGAGRPRAAAGARQIILPPAPDAPAPAAAARRGPRARLAADARPGLR